MEGGEEETDEFDEKGWSFDSFAPAESFDNDDDAQDDDSSEIDVDANRKIALPAVLKPVYCLLVI